ncbi:hypothetical protein, conserved [Trypanosoma brucei brucei TREU927]|uniref:Uncharacterized protein n=1 Tax=Trypanosoma brucei brucei (strain 927/4 GUTat10.1) TaxID=185431 RepID=Q381A6_TRYB2|nr:hypothetical protein, conserved [Trypanosoma brucei brucei TREU927]EAN80625.1 hypothetical protein, conserved [Trypanosoma brucei brucei TREU927]
MKGKYMHSTVSYTRDHFTTEYGYPIREFHQNNPHEEQRRVQAVGFAVHHSRPSMVFFARALQECSMELHIGPYGQLTLSVGAEGEVIILRPRAGDVLCKLSEFPTYYELCRAFFAGSGAGPSALHPKKDFKRKQQLIDGHGRLLVLCASLLRQLLSSEARYPVVDTMSATRNRLRIIRILRALTSPGELRDISVSPISVDGEVSAMDFIERIVTASLRDLQVPSHRCKTSVPRSVLAGCIHFTLSTEVEGDALLVLEKLLLDFLCTPFHHGRNAVPAQTISARARLLLEDPATCLVPCLGSALTYSRSFPCGSFFLPTVAPTFNAHQGADTPHFVLDGRGTIGSGSRNCDGSCTDSATSGGRCYLVMLLVIDHEGGLLDFLHARPPPPPPTRSNESEVGEVEMGRPKGGARQIEGEWTSADQQKAQLEASRMLYDWAWANDVSVIITPSHAPPVMKTFGARYYAERNSHNGVVGAAPVFMVDEVDTTAFDAMIRRLQVCRRDTFSTSEDMCACPDVAVLRRGRLVLPDRLANVIIPARFVAHGDLETLLAPHFPFTGPKRVDSSAKRGLLLKIDGNTSSPTPACPHDAAVGEVGTMLLVSPSSHLQRSHIALLLKCAGCVLLAVDTSVAGRGWAAECGLGFVRAGGALQMSLARQMRAIAESLRSSAGGCQCQSASIPLTGDVPVLAAVLDVLSEALCELPRRVVGYVTDHHYPLRRAWLQFESDELWRRSENPRPSMRAVHNASALHVYIREDLAFYDDHINVTSYDRETQRRYFCKSDTESSGSDNSESEGPTSRVASGFCGSVDWNEGPATLSFVEPVAVTAGMLRAALTFVRLVLSSENTLEANV